MSRNISLFTDYHQGENVISNYCGLMMKLIYEESPGNFEEMLTSLVGPKKELLIGPTFNQQTKEIVSIPDLTISQQSFMVFFENKIQNWHYSEQILNHCKSLLDKKADVKILFLLAKDYDSTAPEEKFEDAIIAASKENIIIKPITYEDLAGAMKNVCSSEYLMRFYDEFEEFLDIKELFPEWKYLLDVVNCAGSIDEINTNKAYICPAEGTPYSHRKAKYFGPYANKKVEKIYEIKGVVVTGINLIKSIVKWNYTDCNVNDLIKEADGIVKKCRAKDYKSKSFQVFLLENEADTNFIKDTAGGLYQSKKYFWEIAIDCNSSKELAEKLNNKNWSDFE